MWVKSMEAFFLCVSSSLCLCAERSACPVANLTLSGKKTLLLFLFLLFFTLVSLHLPFGITDVIKLFWARGLPLGWASDLLYSTLQWEGKEVVVITHCALESFQTLSGYQSWRWRELEDQLYLELKLWKRLKQNLWRFQLGLSSSVHWLILLLFT